MNLRDKTFHSLRKYGNAVRERWTISGIRKYGIWWVYSMSNLTFTKKIDDLGSFDFKSPSYVRSSLKLHLAAYRPPTRKKKRHISWNIGRMKKKLKRGAKWSVSFVFLMFWVGGNMSLLQTPQHSFTDWRIFGIFKNDQNFHISRFFQDVFDPLL